MALNKKKTARRVNENETGAPTPKNFPKVDPASKHAGGKAPETKTPRETPNEIPKETGKLSDLQKDVPEDGNMDGPMTFSQFVRSAGKVIGENVVPDIEVDPLSQHTGGEAPETNKPKETPTEIAPEAGTFSDLQTKVTDDSTRKSIVTYKEFVSGAATLIGEASVAGVPSYEDFQSGDTVTVNVDVARQHAEEFVGQTGRNRDVTVGADEYMKYIEDMFGSDPTGTVDDVMIGPDGWSVIVKASNGQRISLPIEAVQLSTGSPVSNVPAYESKDTKVPGDAEEEIHKAAGTISPLTKGIPAEGKSTIMTYDQFCKQGCELVGEGLTNFENEEVLLQDGEWSLVQVDSARYKGNREFVVTDGMMTQYPVVMQIASRSGTEYKVLWDSPEKVPTAFRQKAEQAMLSHE